MASLHSTPCRVLLFLTAASLLPAHAAPQTLLKPTALRCDSLTEPLGIDTPRPTLSWQLRDPAFGAHQTAYQVTVFSKLPTTAGASADIWDSGRITAATSVDVPYAGPALVPEKRYYWRVQAWGQDGQPYPVSETSWFETGLLTPANWHAQWIGYEEAELHNVRDSGAAWITNQATPNTPPTPAAADAHHDFRFPFTLDTPVARAVLYTTGKDTAAAWLNGKPVLQPVALTKATTQMPWGTYRRQDVTSAIQPGANLLAIEVTRYRQNQKSLPATAPMSACLYVLFRDGSTRTFTSATAGWTAELNAAPGWEQPAAGQHWLAAVPHTDHDDGLPWPTGPVAALRRTFTEQQPVVSARLYATALGAYKFRINGSPVGDQVMAPGWMDFREHVAYQVYDVTRQIRRGDNAIAALLAPGWYSTPLRWYRQGNNYGGTQPALKAQLRLEHSDGSVEWIATNANWKAATSPILQAEIYDGETMDARNELPGWDTPGAPTAIKSASPTDATLNEASWHPASLVTPKTEPLIVAQFFQPIREEKVLTAKAITQPQPGVYVLDFGQNMSAVPRLRVHGTRGDTIKLRFAEVLNADGTLYTDNLRSAKATDRYILSGRGAVEQYQPLFTFHGFRYAEITGLRTPPTIDTLKAVVLYTDAPITARFATSDPMVNQLFSNILWGQRSNFVGTPTDCPQRDERLGWSADAQVFWRTAAYDMDLAAFSRKFAADLHGTQVGTAMYGIYAPGVGEANDGYAAAWSDAGVIIPWTGWIQSGDPRIIEQNWSGMDQYLSVIEKDNPGYLWNHNFGTPYGDWLTPTITTPEDLLATAYWAYDVTLMQQMASATGRSADAARYAALFARIKAAFQKAYISRDGASVFVSTVDKYYSIPPPTLHPDEGAAAKSRKVETQTGYVLALHMNLLPADERAGAADRLVQLIKENHWLLGTGFVGTPYLLEVLSDTGHSDVAYRLLLNKDYPSWGYLIAHGATTTWERWNGDQMRDDPSMNSYNHYAYGAVGEWMYRYAAGIDALPGSAGFQTVYLHPHFDARMARLSFDYDSPYGTIHSDWSTQKGRITWKVVIPPNATAVLPLDEINATNVLLNGAPLSASKKLTAVPATNSGAANPSASGSNSASEPNSSSVSSASSGTNTGTRFSLPAGTYLFTATLNQPASAPDVAEASH